MCWPGPFEFRWLKGYIYIPFYYHNPIGSIHHSHCCHIFPWLCVWDGCTTIFCHLSPDHWDLVSVIDVQSIDVQSMVFANDRIHYGLQVVFVWLQITPFIIPSLSSLWRLIWRHWTNTMLVMYMLPSVCLRLRLFSQLSFIQYMGLCVISSPNSPVMIVRMCALSYYRHQIRSMNH